MATISTTTKSNVPYTFDAVWSVVTLMSKSDKRHLVEKLVAEEHSEPTHDFPKIGKSWKPLPIVYKMVENHLPTEVNI